jgi:hypothetical protein
MSGFLFILFLSFGLIYRCQLSYYRSLLIALLCQFIAFKFTDLHPLFRWSMEWIVPLCLMLYATLKEENLSLTLKSLFLIVCIALSLLGIWDYQLSHKLPLSQPAEASTFEEKWKIFPGLPSEKKLKENLPEDNFISSSDKWVEIVSQEGKFKVMSPLPAATQKERRKVQNNEILITQTRIKDIHEGVYYVVLTTHYPPHFDLPSAQEQAQVALEHLARTYEYDGVIEMEAIEHEGLEGLGFHLKRTSGTEHLMGLILPSCQTILYQVLVFTQGDQEASLLAEKFLFSFKPFPCSPSALPKSS